MAKTKQQKQEVIDNISKSLAGAKSATLSSFSSLSVKDDQELRRSLRAENISYSVVKKTLLNKIFEKLGYYDDSIANLSGNIGLAISQDDEVAPARIINNFSKEHDSVKLEGGVLENAWVDQNKVMALAKLPSKTELIASTVGTIKAPLNSFVNALAGNIRNLTQVLNALKESKS